MRLAVVYTIIALIATAANLGAQELTVRAWHGAFQIEISVFIGTGVGLVVKYVLDKIFIFRFRAASTLHDLHTFILYTAMGVDENRRHWRHFRDRRTLLLAVGGARGLRPRAGGA